MHTVPRQAHRRARGREGLRAIAGLRRAAATEAFSVRARNRRELRSAESNDVTWAWLVLKPAAVTADGRRVEGLRVGNAARRGPSERARSEGTARRLPPSRGSRAARRPGKAGRAAWGKKSRFRVRAPLSPRWGKKSRPRVRALFGTAVWDAFAGRENTAARPQRPGRSTVRGPGHGLTYCRYLVDPASSHMLVSKIKPCMSKYKL